MKATLIRRSEFCAAAVGCLVMASIPAARALPYPDAVLTNNPIAYWRLGESNGATVATDSIGGHQGNYFNVSLGQEGYSPLDPDTGGGFGILSGSDSYVGENDNTGAGVPYIDFSSQGTSVVFSVEAWVNGSATQNSSAPTIVAKGPVGGEEFALDAGAPGNHFRFFVRRGDVNTSVQVFASLGPDGNWHHLVGVCDEPGGSLHLYIDGVENAAAGIQAGWGINSSSTPVSIGSRESFSGSGYDQQFTGTIDEVALYTNALSAAQVQAHYTAAPRPPSFTLVPTNSLTAYRGATVTLAAVAIGSAPLFFQWSVNGAPISGETNTSLVLTNVQPNLSGNIYVVTVTNAYGTNSSPGTVLTVPVQSGPPVLVTDVQPPFITLYSGDSITYSVQVLGSDPLSYQWKINGNTIPGATNASYTLNNLQLTNSGAYMCVITNTYGPLDSGSASLTVVPGPTNAYALTVLADHPIAYYRLDETAGSTVAYDYWGGNNGTYFNATLGVPGYNPPFDPDTAAQFGPSANIYVGGISNIDFATALNGEFSVEAWVKGNATQINGAGIITKGTGNGDEQFDLDVHSSQFRFFVRDATTAAAHVANGTTGPPLDGLWHHVVGVCDQAGGFVAVYLDGNTNGIGALASGTGIHDTAFPLSIGSRWGSKTSNSYNLNFNGSIDEVALYNYALSPAQVQAHFTTGSYVGPVPLSAHASGNQITITWVGAWPTATLQTSTNLNGTWVTIPGATSSYTTNMSGSQQFYRLKVR